MLEAVLRNEFFGGFKIGSFEFGDLKDSKILQPTELPACFNNAQSTLDEVFLIGFRLRSKVKKIGGYLSSGDKIFHKKTTPVTGWK